ncbi:MAG: undecaprenyldiphospho-muramoylpentapeptide beta-N-acetylglucosaminyltransferase [Desulfomonile tiedjei]|nr:undecaprenyldiphospho-muramoylpentapeptide beta-N-acetylglucosaminyltransferase [Desulfomonile tiedjei]
MRLLIAGGGTGGHLFPALAIAKAVRDEAPDAKILFVGTRHGIEKKIIPRTEYEIRYITARGMRKTGLINNLRGLLELPVAMIQSVAVIRDFKPGFVIGVGGYASGPIVAAAVLMRIPNAIQEQNSVMGTTNRILSRFVDKIFISWEQTDPPSSPEKTILAGNPIREDLLPGSGSDSEHERFNILVFGGSRGARSLNLAIAGNLDLLAPLADRISVLHQTGEGATEDIRAAYDAAGIEADVREFIHEMGPAYDWADMVVSRSGASTLAELTAIGKPAIVIPYPYAIRDHQTRNARVLESGGAVRVISDQELSNGSLVKEIRAMAENPGLLSGMAENSRKFGRPDAARTIALEILKAERGRL